MIGKVLNIKRSRREGFAVVDIEFRDGRIFSGECLISDVEKAKVVLVGQGIDITDEAYSILCSGSRDVLSLGF